MKGHPCWKGTFLALAFVLALVFGRALSAEAPYETAGNAILAAAKGTSAPTDVIGPAALAGGLVIGGALASIPGRVRRRREPRLRSTWQGCLGGFFGGLALLFGAMLAGGGAGSLGVTGVLQGSVSGLVFTGAALVAGFVAACLLGRRRGA